MPTRFSNKLSGICSSSSNSESESLVTESDWEVAIVSLVALSASKTLILDLTDVSTVDSGDRPEILFCSCNGSILRGSCIVLVCVVGVGTEIFRRGAVSEEVPTSVVRVRGAHRKPLRRRSRGGRRAIFGAAIPTARHGSSLSGETTRRKSGNVRGG